MPQNALNVKCLANSMSFDYVYLDYAATAPLYPEAAQAFSEYMQAGPESIEFGANANSLHGPGRRAFENMEQARKRISKCLGASRPSEIIFASGATEADNAALFGITQALSEKRHYANARGASAKNDGGNENNESSKSAAANTKNNKSLGHVVVSAIEHEAVLQPALELKRRGYEVSILEPNSSGFISADSLERVLQDNTLLVSVMTANSEIGSIQPISELAQLAHAKGALFHTDATQALGKIALNVAELGVDAASFSAHKIGAPKGVGALYLKARTPFKPLLLGGGQEEGKRSTTQNVAGIAAFAAACECAQNSVEAEYARLSELRNYAYECIEKLPGVRATVDISKAPHHYLPNIVHMLVSGFESETLILRLDALGFGVSGGSACSSHSLEPSHVLRAIGISADDAYGALRVSMGRYTTKEQLDAFFDALVRVIS